MTVCRYLSLLMLALVACSLTAGEDTDFRRAHGYYTLQEYKLAADAFDTYIKAHPKAENLDQARLLLAESRYQLKQYPEAGAAFDAFLKEHPASARRPDALLRAAKVHFINKAYDKSLTAAETFINENKPKLGKPDAHPALPTQMATALYYGGEDSYALKQFEKAKLYWDELVKSHANSPLVIDASEGLGWIAFDAKQYDQALAYFQVTAKAANHPRAAWSKLMEGRALAALKKTDEALAAYKAALALTGGKEVEGEAALRSAEALANGGRNAEAVEAYKKLAAEHPNLPATPAALASAAALFSEANQHAEAALLADLYLKSVKPGTDVSAILRLKARALTAQNKGGDALDAAKKAVEQSAALTDAARKAEDHPAALLLLAELSGAQGESHYKEIVRLYPETRFALVARYELARLAGQGGRIDEAYEAANGLVQQFAKTPPQQEALINLRRDALYAAGEFAFRKKDFKAAEQHLKAYKDAAGAGDTRADDVARKMAWCRQESGDFAGAATLLDAALKDHPKSTFRDEMLYLRALSAAKNNDADGAVSFYETLAKELPASPFADDALYDAAALLYKNNKAPGAIGKLTALIENKQYATSPLLPLALQLRATALLQAGQGAAAQADCDALLKLPVTDELKARLPAIHLLRALALLAQPEKSADAETALNETIEAGPADAPEVKQALLRRAHLRFDQKKFAEAKVDFAQLAGKPNEPLTAETLDAALRLALCHKELKEGAQAKELLARIAQQKLEGVAAFEVPFQLGNFAFEQGDHAAATAGYQQALKAAADLKDLPVAARAAAQLNLAWSLKRLNKPDQAEQAFAALLALDPEGQYAAEALYERGRLLQELNKSEDALKSWQQLLDKHAENPLAEKALFLRSQSLAKAALFDDAIKGFDAYIQKYPKGASLREALAGLGECRMNIGDADGARKAFNQALGDKGIDTDLDEVVERSLLGLAELSLKQGDALNAKKVVLRILTERPQSAWRDGAYYFAAQASEKLGEPEKAIGYYRKLLEENPKSTHAEKVKDRLKALGAPVKE